MLIEDGASSSSSSPLARKKLAVFACSFGRWNSVRADVADFASLA